MMVAVNGLAQGDAARDSGKRADAIAQYRTALEALPNDPVVLERLITESLNLRRPDMAIVYLRQLVRAHGWTSQRSLYMADALTIQGDKQQATIYLRASLNGSKADIPALRQLIDTSSHARDWATVTDLLNKLLTLAPGDERALYLLGLLTVPNDPQIGLAYLQRAAVDPEYRPAVQAIQSAITLSAQKPAGTGAFQVGLAMSTLKLWPYAERALTIAIQSGENTPAALALLGLVQDQQDQDGWPLIQQALGAAPNDPMANYAAALHWRLAGDTPKALAALARAETLDPKNPAIAAEIASVYESLGRLDYAAQWLHMAVSLAPQNPSFQTLLTNFYASSGYDLKGQGLDAIRKIAEQLPKDAEVRANLGWALFSGGQFDAARAELDQALVIDPTNIRAHYYLAIFLENRRDVEGAIKEYLYVYRDPAENSFKDLAVAALRRLGYNVDPDKAGQ
jgi:Flp pilus assembly protein TadD